MVEGLCFWICVIILIGILIYFDSVLNEWWSLCNVIWGRFVIVNVLWCVILGFVILLLVVLVFEKIYCEGFYCFFFVVSWVIFWLFGGVLFNCFRFRRRFVKYGVRGIVWLLEFLILLLRIRFCYWKLIFF